RAACSRCTATGVVRSVGGAIHTPNRLGRRPVGPRGQSGPVLGTPRRDAPARLLGLLVHDHAPHPVRLLNSP
ncbi:hypothetical protein, partial [Actinomadura roseirufa]|uniref:hypothetical protein n=1 Tax=Actinomadura roseirufa TaxID=2094049 RepID=UPI001A955DBE